MRNENVPKPIPECRLTAKGKKNAKAYYEKYWALEEQYAQIGALPAKRMLQIGSATSSGLINCIAHRNTLSVVPLDELFPSSIEDVEEKRHYMTAKRKSGKLIGE